MAFKNSAGAVLIGLCWMQLVWMPVALSDSAYASDDQMPQDAKEVIAAASNYEDAKSWRALGHRWAGALDAEGDLIAIYDLSYPDLRSRLKLGTVGTRGTTKNELVELFRNAAQQAEDHDDAELGEEAANALSRSESRGGYIDELPANWWKSVPWAQDRVQLASASEPPAEFTLGDIAFEPLVKKQKKYQKLKEEGENAVETVEERRISILEFLRQFHFVRQEDGSYAIYFSASSSSSLEVTRPRKIADLSSTRAILYREIAWSLYQKAISFAVDQIPTVPVVSALIGTAMDRYFTYRSMLVKSHNAMAYEMLNSAANGEPISGFDSLSEEDGVHAAVSMILAEAGVFSAWKWIFKKPSSKWRGTRKDENKQGEKSLNWLADHRWQVTSLNSRFATGLSPEGSTGLFLLGRSHSKKRGPIRGVDYGAPDAEREKRLKTEITTLSVEFGSRLIPGAGSLIRKAYDRLVVRPLDKTKIWEARLIAHLEQRELQTKSCYARELAILDGQIINPRELPRSDMLELMARRRQLLGLPTLEEGVCAANPAVQ